MNPYLLPSLELGPIILARLMERIASDRWDEAQMGRFTPREAIAHLADWELILFDRMKAGVASPGAAVEAYDEGEIAALHRYHEADVIEQLALFRQRRLETVLFLKARSADDWRSWISHPERGELSLSDQANMLLGHDLYHIEALSALL